jgi:hypothetical protein
VIKSVARLPSGGSKAVGPILHDFWNVKNPSKHKQRYFLRPNLFLSPIPPALLLVESGVRIARELWWTNQEFPLPVSFHHAHISTGGWKIGPLAAAVQRRGLIPST